MPLLEVEWTVVVARGQWLKASDERCPVLKLWDEVTRAGPSVLTTNQCFVTSGRARGRRGFRGRLDRHDRGLRRNHHRLARPWAALR